MILEVYLLFVIKETKENTLLSFIVVISVWDDTENKGRSVISFE